MADFNEYKGVWVFCEQRQGALMSTDFELVSEARKLADELGCEVTGIGVRRGRGMYESSRKGLAMHGTRHAVVVTHTQKKPDLRRIRRIGRNGSRRKTEL